MTIGHILILGFFVFFGSLGLASIQTSMSLIFSTLRKSASVGRARVFTLTSTADSQKLSWK